MPGYKVMLRVLAIIIVLGIIGFGIFYFVSGGFSNAKATYNTFSAIQKSEENAYMQQIDDSKVDLLSSFNHENESNVTEYGFKFRKYYQTYLSFNYVLGEIGEELYFATKKGKELDAKYNSFYASLKKVYGDFKTFDESYNTYKSQNSAGGTSLTSWEENELAKLAPMVFSSTQNLAQEAYNLSGVCYDYVVKNCLGGSAYGNLKYTMLKAINGQTMVLFDATHEGKNVSDLNSYLTYMTNALNKYKNEKSSNFSSELNTSSAQFEFKHVFYTLSSEELTNLYQSTNKTEYVGSLTGNNKNALQKTSEAMGWMWWKNIFLAHFCVQFV